jgi:hypothetical protein
LSWNPYIYVKDNAVNAIDPTGRGAAEEAAGDLESLEEYQEVSQNPFYRIITEKTQQRLANILKDIACLEDVEDCE